MGLAIMIPSQYLDVKHLAHAGISGTRARQRCIPRPSNTREFESIWRRRVDARRSEAARTDPGFSAEATDGGKESTQAREEGV
jgi:hypothetical protein